MQPPHACQVRPQPRRPGPSCLRCSERRAEACTAAENAADAPEAYASEATDNSEIRTAAVNAADATEAATVKKPTGRRSDGTSEKEVEARAFKKPSGKLSTDAAEFNPSRRPHHREH